jgi:hypothetical protein
MPPTAIDLEPYRAAIEQRLLIDHQSHSEVVAWLEKEGVTIAPRTLRRRCNEWGVTRRALTSDVAATAQVEQQYFSTHASDEAIAATLNAQGLHLSAIQVRRARTTRPGFLLHATVNESQSNLAARLRTFLLFLILLSVMPTSSVNEPTSARQTGRPRQASKAPSQPSIFPSE